MSRLRTPTTLIPIMFWVAVAVVAVATFGPGGTHDNLYLIMWWACLPLSMILGPILFIVAAGAQAVLGTSSWIVLPVAWMGIAAIQATLLRLLITGATKIYRRSTSATSH